MLHARPLILALATLFLGLSCEQSRVSADVSEKNQRHTDSTWQGFVTEAKLNDLVLTLSRKHKPQTVVFEHVNLITMLDDTSRPDQSVLVEDGVIMQIGAAGSFAIPPNALRVDGTDRYLMPGLTDAHVHIGESNVEKLLNIATGVTTVREMAGFPWMVAYRDKILANEILAPNLYIAGPMLNYHSLGIYTQVVRTPEEARQRVQAQKALGFDFIKVQPSSLMNFGYALAEVGETEEAVDIMKRTLARYPSYDVYEALGDAYLSHADTTQALGYYQRSVELYSYNQAAKDKIKQITGVPP